MASPHTTGQRRPLDGLARRVEQAIRARVYRGLAERGFADLRPAHARLLDHLPPDGARVSELAEQAHIAKQSMAYLAEHLEALGYVAMEPDPTDGRAKLVRLTDRGEAAVEAMARLSAEAEAGLADQLGRAEMAELRRLLEALSARLA